MLFEPDNVFHIYNRGNNQQRIFFKRENYLFFLRKIRTELLPFCHILSYCLMPNHFHFQVYVKSVDSTRDNRNALPCEEIKTLNNAIAVTLRSYAQAINKQENRTGSLFQQKTKAKCLTIDMETDQKRSSIYPLACFNYIHRNPYEAGLVNRIEGWEFSSFQDYLGLRNGTLCNQKLAQELLEFPADKRDFYQMSYQDLLEDAVKGLFV